MWKRERRREESLALMQAQAEHESIGNSGSNRDVCEEK
jgi:hypothetical protein